MKGTLYLVNRAHPLPEEPAAEDLASVRSGQTEVRLHQRAKVMLDQLLAAVDGAGTIIPVSGYRPQTEQQAIWEDALAEHGKAFTETYVARPGCSEHQTGLAIDLGENRPEVDFLCPAFPDSGPCGALRRRAADFGFVLRYPADKESVTGISYESWHYRYVGRPHARVMADRGLCLEEYLDLLRQYSKDAPLSVTDDGRAYQVYFCPENDPLVPAGNAYTLSGNNVDGFLVTLLS